MKKLLKILTMVAAVVTTAILFTTCKQFRDDPEEFLSYWSAEVVPRGFDIDKPHPTNADGVLCVPSASPVTITIKLHNPKKFTLITPTSTSSAADVQKIISFPGLSTPPAYNTDYTLEQTPDKTELKLTYNSVFLKKHEWGTGSIGPEITLISTDGRKFNKKFSLNIEANTPPPEIGDITIAKDGTHYVLCFTVQDTDMGTTIAGGNLHKDLGLVITKEGGETKKIPLPIGSSGFDVNPAAGLLPSALQIIDPVPSETWKVCFKTDTGLTESTLPQKYTVRLTDTKGLSSTPKEAHTLGYIPDISGADTAWKKLKTAVENSEAGGIITVMGEVKATKDTGNNGTINVTKKIILKGAGIDPKLNADSNNTSLQHNIFTVKDGGELTLENLTLTNGNGSSWGGGAVLVNESCTLNMTNCNVNGCKVDNSVGGAIHAEGKKTLVYIKGGEISGNRAREGGGISLSNGAKAVLENCTITLCKETISSIGGGGMYANGATVKMTNCTLMGNEAEDSGGAIFATGSSVELTNCTITGNKADTNGGGIYAQKEGTTPSIVTISGGFIGKKEDGDDGNSIVGHFGTGGGIYVGEGCILTMKAPAGSPAQGVQLIGNSATNGGGVYAEKATANITSCTLMNNVATKGGGVYGSESQITIPSCTLMSNGAGAEGGGIYTYKGKLTMTSCTLTGNTSHGPGGGMTISDGIADIKDCSLRGNTAVFAGGAIVVRKDNTRSEVTISGGTIGGTGTNDANTATVNGGGIYVGEDCTLTLNKYTPEGSGTAQGVQLIGNTAVTAGGGVYVSNSGTLKMKGSACVTPSTGGDEDEPGKNDVYLEDDTKITLDGELSPAGGTAARITVADSQYNPARQVLDGNITAGTAPNQNYRKFTVTPKSGQMWYVDSNGKLTTSP